MPYVRSCKIIQFCISAVIELWKHGCAWLATSGWFTRLHKSQVSVWMRKLVITLYILANWSSSWAQCRWTESNSKAHSPIEYSLYISQSLHLFQAIVHCYVPQVKLPTGWIVWGPVNAVWHDFSGYNFNHAYRLVTSYILNPLHSEGKFSCQVQPMF